MPNISRPNLNAFGNSFGHSPGNNVFETIPRGDIDLSGLGNNTFTEDFEFNKFEESIKDFVLARLGYPTIRVELTPFQIKTCIDEAVSKLYFHAPMWATQYAVFGTSPGVTLYELPQYMLDNLTYVVYKKTLLSVARQQGTLEFDFFIKYFQENFLMNDFSIGDLYLMQSHLEMTRKILGNDGSFEVINNQYLQISPAPVIEGEEVIVEYRAIDSNTIHPAYRNFIQRYALALAKGILGQIRSKYVNVPSPGGGAKLNGERLLMDSEKELEVLNQQLSDEFEEGPSITMY